MPCSKLSLLREVELKGVAQNPDAVLKALRSDGAEVLFEGRLLDRRYDTFDRSLAIRDCVLRLRIYENTKGVTAEFDSKGPTGYENSYKVRNELTTDVTNAVALARMLDDFGYVGTREIDRRIVQFRWRGAVVLLRASKLCEHRTTAAFDLKFMVGGSEHKVVLDESGCRVYSSEVDWGLKFLSVKLGT